LRWSRASIPPAGPGRRSSTGCSAPVTSRPPKCTGCSTAASAWSWSLPRATRRRRSRGWRRRAKPRTPSAASNAGGPVGRRAWSHEPGQNTVRAMKRLVVLISGRGSNMAAILEAERAGAIAGHVVSVISNRADAAGLAVASARGVPTTVVDERHHHDRGPISFEQALVAAIDALSPDLIVLAGFMRILSAELVAR